MKIWEFGRIDVFSNRFILVMADLKRIPEALRKKCTLYRMPFHARALCNQIFTPKENGRKQAQNCGENAKLHTKNRLRS